MKDDLISRQAVIDLLKQMRKDGDMVPWEGKDVFARIRKLPSARSEQPWIPCSEGPPEHGGRYLISVLDGINRRTTVAPYMPRCKAWTMTGRMTYWKVIAWMPLPEPWKGGKE